MKFDVDTKDMDKTLRSMKTELDNITRITDRLYSALEALDSMWDGPAHDVFMAQYITDQQKIVNMTRTIFSIMEGIQDAGKTYEKAERSIKSEIQRIWV